MRICCAKRRLDRKAAGRTSELPVASRIVREVLASPGRPLGERLRHELEPLFSHDFSGVRVHADSRADASCRAVEAEAYTVGEHIAFAEGRYRPESREGLRLLGHELATSSSSPARPKPAEPMTWRSCRPNPPRNARPTGPERGSSRGHPIGRMITRTGRRQLQRADGKNFSCGVEVTDLVKGALKDARTAFAGWDEDKQIESCQALSSLTSGDIAWDILEMHRQVDSDWLNLKFRPPCATSGATPACGSSVTVDGGCHFAGSANYVIFGVMCRLCSTSPSPPTSSTPGTSSSIGIRSAASDAVLGVGDAGAHRPLQEVAPPAPVRVGRRQHRGRQGLVEGRLQRLARRGVARPDRSNCVTDCPHKADYSSFTVSWYPYLNPYKRRRGVRS